MQHPGKHLRNNIAASFPRPQRSASHLKPHTRDTSPSTARSARPGSPLPAATGPRLDARRRRARAMCRGHGGAARAGGGGAGGAVAGRWSLAAGAGTSASLPRRPLTWRGRPSPGGRFRAGRGPPRRPSPPLRRRAARSPPAGSGPSRRRRRLPLHGRRSRRLHCGKLTSLAAAAAPPAPPLAAMGAVTDGETSSLLPSLPLPPLRAALPGEAPRPAGSAPRPHPARSPPGRPAALRAGAWGSAGPPGPSAPCRSQAPRI